MSDNKEAKQGLFNYDGHINTRSGIKFSLFDPKEDQIVITDISHGLAYKGHFGGQTPQFFSIAQHSLLVVDLLPSRWRNHKPEIALAALLHDASEAYIGDMIKPLKIHLPKFSEIEDKITRVIFKRCSIDLRYLKTIKEYDKKAQQIEFDLFYKGVGGMNYLNPERSNHCFIQKFYDLYNQINTIEL